MSVQTVPRGALMAAGALVLVSIVSAGAARITDLGTVRMSEARPLTSIRLAFEDREDGSVAVLDAASGTPRAVYATGEGGFVRSVVRGLVRQRNLEGIGRETPFELTRWEDGRLSLADPATGRRVELDAFGPDNVMPFLQLLSGPG